MSQEPSVRNFSTALLFLPIRSMAIWAVASGVRMGIPGIFTGVNWPLSSTCGGRPGEKIRSLTCLETPSIATRIESVVGTAWGGGGATVALGAAGFGVIATVVPPSNQIGRLRKRHDPPPPGQETPRSSDDSA